MKMANIGIQLYSLKDLAQDDLIRVLERVAKIGFDGVEFAGYFGVPAKKIRKALDASGLKAAGSHIGFETLSSRPDETVDFSREIGLSTIVCTGFPDSLHADRESWTRLAEKLDAVSQYYVDRGIRCGYQNHDFEFRRFGDETALDIVMAKTDRDRTFLELDVFWAEYCGFPAAYIIAKYPGRCKFLHLTDMKRRGDKQNVEAGKGILDFKAIANAAMAEGTEWYIVKQVNFEIPPLESIRQSLHYLRKILSNQQ
jgi:sugar phosphate isomerase/epimerase